MKHWNIILKSFLGGFFCLPLIFGCHYKIGSRYDNIPSTKLYHKYISYMKKYGDTNTLNDTVVIDKNLKRYYSNGYLKRIGKIDKTSRKETGYWFEMHRYSTVNYVQYIIHYEKEKVDSFYRPFSVLHPSF